MDKHPGTNPRRMKTYTGGQGYVYQYYFVGKRTALATDAHAPATEYIFDVTSDRKTTFAVSVFVRDNASRQWAELHGRALTDAEQYGAVKMRLFKAFDEVEDMMSHGRELLIDKEALDRYSRRFRIEIPSLYTEVLTELNGAFCFGMSLCGVPGSMQNNVPVLW